MKKLKIIGCIVFFDGIFRKVFLPHNGDYVIDKDPDPIIPEEKSENNTNSGDIDSDEVITVDDAIHLAFNRFYPDRCLLN